MSYDPHYSPFPEQELLEFAASTPAKGLREAIHNAIAAHAALRERFLNETTLMRAMQARPENVQ